MDITLNSIKISYILVDFVFIYWKHILTHWFQCILYFYNKKPTDGDVVQLSKNEVAWVQPMLPVKGQGRMWICRMDNFTKIYMLILWVLKEQEKKMYVQLLMSITDTGTMEALEHFIFHLYFIIMSQNTYSLLLYFFFFSETSEWEASRKFRFPNAKLRGPHLLTYQFHCKLTLSSFLKPQAILSFLWNYHSTSLIREFIIYLLAVF